MEVIGDGVVVLTLFDEGDAPVMAEADDDAEIRRWFEFPRDFRPSTGHSAEVVSRWAAERAAGIRFTYAVRSAATGELLGGCELRPGDSNAADVSYWTYPGHRGRGVATRALRLLCSLAFNEMGLDRLEALVHPDNTASRRVAVAGGFAGSEGRDGKPLFVRECRNDLPPN